MLYITGPEFVNQFELINSDCEPFKCGVDICFNKRHTRVNLTNGRITYVQMMKVYKGIYIYEVKKLFKPEVKIGKNILCISPYCPECSELLIV